jgi:hypothetical protein
MSTTEAILETVNALPPEKREQLLDYAKSLVESPSAPKSGEPYSALRSFAKLNIDGPADASSRFHEYLYGENARDNK